MNAGAIHMKTGKTCTKHGLCNRRIFPGLKNIVQKPKTTKQSLNIKPSKWIGPVHSQRKAPEKNQAQGSPGQFGRTTLVGSAELTGGPPWPIFLWRFVTDVWRSVPPAINATDVWNRLQVADLPRL